MYRIFLSYFRVYLSQYTHTHMPKQSQKVNVSIIPTVAAGQTCHDPDTVRPPNTNGDHHDQYQAEGRVTSRYDAPHRYPSGVLSSTAPYGVVTDAANGTGD
jgi:hypothetical protein